MKPTSGRVCEILTAVDDWYRRIAAESELPSGVAWQLREDGFVVLPGPVIPGGCARLSKAYDRAVSTAGPEDVSIRSSTRVNARYVLDLESPRSVHF
jgi:hypothetical protein